MATWTDVARIVRDLPEVIATPGCHEWRVGGKLLAWERPLRRGDLEALGAAAPKGPILGIYVPIPAKEALLEASPASFFTIPHFNGHPAILVRLPRIGVRALREVLADGWRARAPRRVVKAYDAAPPPAPRRRR